MTRKKIILRVIWFAVCFSVLISAPVMMAANSSNRGGDNNMTMLTVWQIDSFEGGKGSRTTYLQNLGNEFSNYENCYVHVTSVSSEAARTNLSMGKRPDLISYGAGTYGLETYITDKNAAHVWAHGGYCFITLSETADFSDMSNQNTVINRGVENLSGAAALFTGVNGATAEIPTAAYINLINGKYKYLLGTQRDIFRLLTRGENFKLKPIEEFNDLYQLISVTSENPERISYANKFIDFIQSKSENLTKLGLMCDHNIYEDTMKEMEGLQYEYTLKSPVSKNAREALITAIQNSDINLLKNLLK